MTLETDFERVALPLADAFTIARGTSEVAENVLVRISDGEFDGIGGAAPSARYGETADTVEAVLPDLLSVVEEVGDPHQLQRIERNMGESVRRNAAAHCAVSIALHDLVCKRLDVPLYRYWGLDRSRTVETSFTIGIDDPERMAEKAAEAIDDGFSILKVKVGAGRDLAAIRAVRDAAPDATIRVDANEAWAPREAVERVDALAAFDVEFVEQPVPAEHPEGLRFVRERTALPIVADESCVGLEDVTRIAHCADVVNLKLMKCGGLREARRLIATARAHGLEVMLGCMVESNASIAAACHLVPLSAHADLDGSLLLAEDPYDGIEVSDGRIVLDPDVSGTGARATSGPFI